MRGKFTGIAGVSVRLGGTLGDLEVALIRHLVHGVFAAGEQFAGIAVAGKASQLWMVLLSAWAGGGQGQTTHQRT